MRYLVLSTLALFMLPLNPAQALECAPSQNPDQVPDNQLIVRAKVIQIETPLHIPFIRDASEQDDVVTFEIINLYKGPQDMPQTFDARFSHFFKTWGPDLKPGQEGEFLFDQEMGRAWQYSGPGGCTQISEKAWQALRENAPERQ